MHQRQALLRAIWRVDQLANDPVLSSFSVGTRTAAVRTALDLLRKAILAGTCTALPAGEVLIRQIAEQIAAQTTSSLCRVLNATGIILHTNLGRACLSDQAAQAAADAARGYTTLEYSTEQGIRSSRHAHLSALLCRLTGAEDGIAVNNNAAAVLLVLSTHARAREVVLSRGELVEVGGSFRIPDVMCQSGAILREVGATNKTRLSDYAQAISPDTAAIMKVHPANYQIKGFTSSVPLADLAELAHRHHLPLIEDQGGGALVSPALFGAPDEPSVPASIAAGADLVCFSGDKLLGGPQAGIIVGKKRYVEPLKSHPLARALRIDKLCLAALEATLRAYLEPETALHELPVLRMLTATPESLAAHAQTLCHLLSGINGLQTELVETEAQAGGGGLPGQTFPSVAVSLSLAGVSTARLEQSLRTGQPPVIGRLAKDRLLLDLRTLFPADFPVLTEAVTTCVTRLREEMA